MENVQDKKPRERVLQEATFSPNAINYHVVPGSIILACTIVCLPFLLFTIPFSFWYYRLHYSRLRVILTSRDLKVYRGVWNREEKSIPLEKITDLAVFEGPIMRYYGVKGIRVETAGQSSGGMGALVTVIGIENTDDFRDLVLNQRDRIADTDEGEPSRVVPATGASAPGDDQVLATLREIHHVLQRIETALQQPTPDE